MAGFVAGVGEAAGGFHAGDEAAAGVVVRPAGPGDGGVAGEPFHIALGDAEDAGHVAGAGGLDAAGELKAEEGVDGSLDAAAGGEVEVVELEGGGLAGADGGGDALHD